MNLDLYIEKVKKCEFLEESDMRKVVLRAISIISEEPSVPRVQSPISVCGDIHGQFHDLLELFRVGGEMPETSYLFLGDYIDRGFYSLETITYLLLLKIKYPTRITLLRGNHESRNITQIYGFHDECVRKYGQSKIWGKITELFDYLPIAALINESVFCVHGGLSPEIRTVGQICKLQRVSEVPQFGSLADLLWSDPDSSISTWMVNTGRGTGFLFGDRVVDEFNQVNGLSMISRAHQLVDKGFTYHFARKNLVTIWSAPNYTYRCGNLAAILSFDEKLEVTPLVFSENKEKHDDTKLKMKCRPCYFL